MYKATGLIPGTDLRDLDYPMESAPKLFSAAPERFHTIGGFWDDQGNIPRCVGSSTAHWLHAGPIRNREEGRRRRPALTPNDIWGRSQELVWGQRYPDRGSYCDKAFEVLRLDGYVDSYYSVVGQPGNGANAAAAIIDTIIQTGPVVIGVAWTNTMAQPDGDGFIRFDPTEMNPSYHAVLLSGASRSEQYVEVKNSWGRMWGTKRPEWTAKRNPYHNNGIAKLPFTDLEQLFERWAQAIVAVERQA